MNYKLAITGSLRDVRTIRDMADENRKSSKLWELFSKSTELLPENKFTLSSRQVDFITVIRSVYSNKIITFGNNSTCIVRTCEPILTPEMTLDDICIVNAYKAYMQTLQIVNPSKQNDIMKSQPQTMGIIHYHGCVSVYMNVIVDDSVFDLLDTQDARLCEGAQLVPISSFKPIVGSRDEAVLDSLVIVKEEPSSV